MEFLVRLTVDSALPQGDELSRLQRAERARAGELRRDGHLVSLWRVPGSRANVGIWEVDDATQLHELIVSLPMWPYLSAEVDALATHPFMSVGEAG